jgi:hypothetical protein
VGPDEDLTGRRGRDGHKRPEIAERHLNGHPDEQGQALLASVAAPWRAALQEGSAAFRAGNPRSAR